VESIDSTRYRGHFLLELDDAALAALLAELDQATSSERKVKIIGMISWAITERRASLSPDVVQRATKEARDRLQTIDDKNRKRAEGYLEKLGMAR
jgi:hypothetical protein